MSNHAFNEFEYVKSHMKSKLDRELAELHARVAQLEKSNSHTSNVMLSTYHRIIENKQNFMKYWGM